jgi:hypothetical protein
MFYDERKKLESSGRAWNLYKTPWTPKLKRNMRKNMKIPRKKEKPKQPVIIPKIIRLPAWFEPTRSSQAEGMEVVMKNSVCKQLRKRLMNGSITRFETRGSSRRREKTMTIACSSKPDIPLSQLLYLLQYPWIEVYISWM